MGVCFATFVSCRTRRRPLRLRVPSRNRLSRYAQQLFPAPALCAGLVDEKLRAGRVSSVSALHVGPDQPDPRPNPNSNANPNPDPNPFGGLEAGRGSHARLRRRVFWWRFSKRTSVRPKGQPGPIRPAPRTKFFANPSCTQGESLFPLMQHVTMHCL